MSRHDWNRLLLIVGSGLGAFGFAQPIVAQVVSDDTLPVGERSQVSGDPNFQVDGGARRGGNLFHSFSQLSVPTGGSIYFNNAADVQTIFSRVTGGSISNIDGLIQANGTANLFLLNPNGILFGPNGALNIGGSFVATTASSINFADGFQYGVINPQTTPLLTVTAPVGLQMGASPGPISVQGTGYDLSVPVPYFSSIARAANPTGLQVPAGRTLALIGGNIELTGSTLTAEQGKIELSSVRDGQVSFDDSFILSQLGAQTFGNIRLSQQALVDASGGGLIQIQGNQVSLADGSLLLIQNQGIQSDGSIRVNAAQSLELSSSSLDGRISGGLESQTVGVGRGADIDVSTRQLTVRDGAQISARSYNSGKTGNVTMQASDSIQVIGFSFIDPSLLSAIGNSVFSSGDAGDVTVSTQKVTILRGGTIGSVTFGIGRSGDVTVNALDSIELSGQSSLSIRSVLQALTLGSGDAGQLTVNTSRLVIQGGAVSTATLGSGRAGSLTVNASESVEVSGRSSLPSLPNYVGSSAPIPSAFLRRAYQLPDRPGGNSGSVTINTPRLSLTDEANVTASNDGTGSAGTLRVNANSIVVDRGSSITAATASGEGGNIDLNVRDFLLLRNHSQITTSAGDNGGNIQVNAGSIIAIPAEDSDIRANSVNARGGNVTINAAGIFGIQARPQDTPLSDITATGVNSASSGTVQLNVNQLNPTFGLVELPDNLIDPSRLIAQGCPASRGNSFVVTGRGGLPPNPEQQLDDDAGWQDRRRLEVTWSASPSESGNPPANASMSDGRLSNPSLIEATALQIAPNGAVWLVAPAAVAHNPLSLFIDCKGGR
ncbi:filamentous hemagglutinin N-terminal domain-containing protein [Nodosilinea nodulosa]|uniref:two-partner secretion domain-containing protein n=1 Tax=Nodosilinea nodulosa TaxID=416001 RepID=UPI0005947D1D|nr:filamentous hemagglutinin N-terminal domain-containing protein [Nodosilinea nodulosa]